MTTNHSKRKTGIDAGVLLCMLTLVLFAILSVAAFGRNAYADTGLPENIFAGGDGTEDDPYLIETAKQLDSVRFFARGNFFRLIADIDLTEYTDSIEAVMPDESNGWTDNLDQTNRLRGFAPIADTEPSAFPYFSGVFDGDGHTVSGLWMAERGNRIGLFKNLTDAVIKNLTVETHEKGVSGYGTVGIIAGSMAQSTIQNCRVTGTVSGFDTVGAVVGHMDFSATVRNCLVEADIISHGVYVGGVAGRLDLGVIRDCLVRGDIRCVYPLDEFDGTPIPVDHWFIGGLVGVQSAGELRSCFFAGTIVDYTLFYGGLIGEIEDFGAQRTVISCYFAADKNQLMSAAGTDDSLYPAAALTLPQQQDAASFTGWNMQEDWIFSNGVMYLRSFAPQTVLNPPEEPVIDPELPEEPVIDPEVPEEPIVDPEVPGEPKADPDAKQLPVVPPESPDSLTWLWVTLAVAIALAGLTALAAVYRRKKSPVAEAPVAPSATLVRERVPLPDILTKREEEITALILEGCNRYEIASRLFISHGTVKRHIENILRKTDCATQKALIIKYK